MSKKKTALLIVIISVVVVAVIVGVLFIIRNNQKTEVNVYAVSDICASDESASTAESDGMVRTDKMQSVYVSDSQQITEIFVKEGQKVKAGDKILAYDTTLTDLELQKQDVSIQKMELSIENAYDELATIKSYKPYIPKPEPEPEPEPEEPEDPEVTEVPKRISGKGTKKSPYKYMWDYTCSFTEEFITSLFGKRDKVYVQMYVYDQNSLECEKLASWGFCFKKTETGYEFYQYEVVDSLVKEKEPEEEEFEEEIDDSSGFTAAEIAQMRSEKEAEIVQLELELKMAKVEYKKMQNELQSGEVLSNIDGTVTLVTDEDTALSDNSPIVKISGGGGYYVDVTVGEFGLDTIQLGQQVEVYSWDTGMSATGEIVEISDTPTTDGWSWSPGNTNVSYYPFTVFVDESVDLQEYSYVSVRYSVAGEETGGVYIENAFIRTEGGKSYVYADNGGILEKREVQLGKSLWGSYFQIKDGLTMEDHIAFPYGKSVKEGAVTVTAGIDALYTY